MTPKTVYIHTVGCQMNMLDSELVAASLSAAGYRIVDSPREADVVLFNTCSVRQHAEDKIYSALGRLKHVKQYRPDKVIGVLGCMAQKDQEKIVRRFEHVDLVVGPGQLARLPELLEEVSKGHRPILAVSLDRGEADRRTVADSFITLDVPRRPEVRQKPFQAMVRIMTGCDKFCTYCIVPKVRGPEKSRPATEIINEVKQLADQGCVEVTLLGQAVNNYCDRTVSPPLRLADLLEKINSIDGIRRIKFVTNHPRHMTPELLQAVAHLEKVCPYLHVPAQSGSNRILKLMRRGYTVEQYEDMLHAIRETVPDAAVTSDFIVGFCSETEEDFEQTVKLVQKARFKNSFVFKYSPRPGTKAAELYEDDVPWEVKQERNNRLLQVQNAISTEENSRFIGRTVEVLVEGPSKVDSRHDHREDTHQLTGRTVCDRIVVFDGPLSLTGRFVQVEIERVSAVTLFGRLVSGE